MKHRSRKNRQPGEKKFIDNDEENQIPVEEPRHKIEEKTQDKFDAHLLKGNLMKEEEIDKQRIQDQHYHNFGQESLQKSHQESHTEEFQELPSENQNKKKQKRAKRQKKQVIDSDEEVIEDDSEKTEQKEEKEESKLQKQFSEKEQQNAHKKMQFQSNESEEEEANKIQKMIAQTKIESESKAGLFVQMHALLGKAGVSKKERREIIYSPLEKDQHSFVYFKRYQSGLSQYYQVVGEDQRPIMFCENQRGCIGCNYYMSLTKQMDKNNDAYLGKLRGNAAGSIYQLYDFGLQPNKDIDRSKFRISMAYIQYESNFLGMKGPRKLTAITPNVSQLQDFDLFKFSEDESLAALSVPTVSQYRNKQPRWNQKLKSYALNFGGRVKQASIKNFIMINNSYRQNQQDEAPNAVVFGKIDENTFSLEFRYPLSLFQAFGIAMSEFDFKIKCE